MTVPPGEPIIRAASPADLPALARLRYRWVGIEPPAPEALQAFTAALGEWMSQHAETARCAVAELDGELVGMAWLAIVDRPPNPGDLRRRSGDIQSVFVLPEHQGAGIGGALIEAVVDAAREAGVQRIGLHSDRSAIPFYQRLGFSHSERLLQRDIPPR